MINIVVPMAGMGKRFQEVGYADPKPFIRVKDKTMIETVLDNVRPKEKCRVLAITQSVFLETPKYAEHLYKNVDDILTVQKVTEGAACTVLLSEHYINNDDELIIANSDQLILDPDFISNGLKYFRERNADGGIWGFWADNPKWSFGRIALNRIVEVAEKQVISNFATCGIYYFKRGSLFVESAKSMIANNVRVNGEFYVCPVYNQMIIRSLVVLPFFVNDMWGLGTPEDLHRYLAARK